MRDPGGKDCRSPGWYNERLCSDLRSERTRFHHDFFPFMEMHMKGRAVSPGRQRSIHREDGLTFGVTYAADPQGLSGVSDLQL